MRNEDHILTKGLERFDRVGFGLLMRRIEVLLIRGLTEVAVKALRNFAVNPYRESPFDEHGDEIKKLLPDFGQDVQFYAQLATGVSFQRQHETQGEAMAGNLIDALEQVLDSNDESIKEIDTRIAEHHKQIVKLQAMRRVLVGASRVIDRRGGAMHSIDKEDRDSLREQIKTLIAEAGPMKASEIGERLGISYIAVGFILRDCKEIRRQGKHFHLA